MRNCFTPFGSVLDGGEIVCDVPFERSPIGGEPADLFHKGHAGNGECADNRHQLDELSKRQVDEKFCDITSADSRQGRRSHNGNPARQAEEGSHAGEDNGLRFPGWLRDKQVSRESLGLDRSRGLKRISHRDGLGSLAWHAVAGTGVAGLQAAPQPGDPLFG